MKHAGHTPDPIDPPASTPTPADLGQAQLPPTTLLVTSAVLSEVGTYFEERGSHGCEGTALIAGGALEGDQTLVMGDRLVVPDQSARPVPYASVTITLTGELQMATALRADQRYFARIHSHPTLAFHSTTDDRNPILTHHGAISIVVPYFGLGLRQGLDSCAVYVLDVDSDQAQRPRWIELPVGSERARAVRVEDR